MSCTAFYVQCMSSQKSGNKNGHPWIYTRGSDGEKKWNTNSAVRKTLRKTVGDTQKIYRQGVMQISEGERSRSRGWNSTSQFLFLVEGIFASQSEESITVTFFRSVIHKPPPSLFKQHSFNFLPCSFPQQFTYVFKENINAVFNANTHVPTKIQYISLIRFSLLGL